MRRSRNNFFKRKFKFNSNRYTNFNKSNNDISCDIDNINIIKLNLKASDYIENANFGFEFENSINTKTCYKLKARSINDKEIYTKNYRHFHGLKIVLTNFKNNNMFFKSNLLEKGIYKIIPYSNNFFKLKIIDSDPILISYHYYEIIIVNNNYKRIINLNDNKYTEDKYVDSINIYKKGIATNLFISMYIDSVEIDGFFEITREINLIEFGADIIYSSTKNNHIESNSLMIYEIKSGNAKKKLLNQMKKSFHFIYNYLSFFYKVPIYYIGFYRQIDNQKNNIIEIESKTANFKQIEINQNEKEKKDNNDTKEKEINLNNNKNDKNNSNIISVNNIISKNSNSSEEFVKENNNEIDSNNMNDMNDINTNSNFVEKNTKEKSYKNNSNNVNEINNDIKNEKGQENIEKIKKDNKIDNTQNHSINCIRNEEEENEEETEITSKQNLDDDKDDVNVNEVFNNLCDCPINLIVFKLKDKIFGENLKYDKEELNLLGNLIDDVKEIKKDTNGIKEKIQIIEDKTNNLNNEVNELKKEVNELKKEVNGIKEGMNELKDDVSLMKKNIEEIMKILKTK